MDELTAEAYPGVAGQAQTEAVSEPAATCDSCGRAVVAEANFCPYCGSALRPRQVVYGRVPWTVGDILLALVIPGLFFGLAFLSVLFADTPDELSEGELISTFVISMGFQLFLLGIAWFFSVRKYGVSWSALGLRVWKRGSWWSPFAVVGGAFVIIYVWVAVLAVLGWEGGSDLPDETFDYTSTIILLAVLSMFFAPLIEEIFFRGFVFGGLAPRVGVLQAILLSGAIFALPHAGSPDSFLILPAIGAIGCLFAFAYWRTGSLYASIGAHFLFNTTQVVVGVLWA